MLRLPKTLIMVASNSYCMSLSIRDVSMNEIFTIHLTYLAPCNKPNA